MNEVAKYHNDLNKLNITHFNELSQNILFGILCCVKEKKERIELNWFQIKNFTENSKLTREELWEEAVKLQKNLFKLDFTIIKPTENKNFLTTTYNLFTEFSLAYATPSGEKDDPIKLLASISIKINQDFAYLINELTANFTRFELAEFIALSGKYTKTLYRLLKQYRQTGWAQWDFNEFKRILDIPECYRQIDIDQQILKPALKELTKQRNLFDQERIPFKDLSYTKIKGRGRGRGGNVIAIRFDFKPEQVQEELEAQAEARIAENIKNHIPTSADYEAKQEFQNYKGIEVSFYDSKQKLIIATIKDFNNETNQLICYDKKAKQNFYIPFENLQKVNTWIAEKLKEIY